VKPQKVKNEQAVERQARCSEKTCRERLSDLDARLGKGVGAKRERAKLAKLIEAGHA
jgi:hypothetical protein